MRRVFNLHGKETTMRKTTMYALICALATVALLGAGSAFADVMIKGGIDLGGTRDIEGIEDDVEQSYSVAVEFTKPIAKLFHLGGGIEGQFPRSADGEDGTFFFIPLYAVGRLQIPIPLHPYVTGKIGYNFFLGNEDYLMGGMTKGGLHYGFGAGIVIFKFLVAEGSYSVCNGMQEWSGADFDTTYKAWSIKAGVKF
jgi:hypothetical protein